MIKIICCSKKNSVLIYTKQYVLRGVFDNAFLIVIFVKMDKNRKTSQQTKPSIPSINQQFPFKELFRSYFQVEN